MKRRTFLKGIALTLAEKIISPKKSLVSKVNDISTSNKLNDNSKNNTIINTPDNSAEKLNDFYKLNRHKLTDLEFISFVTLNWNDKTQTFYPLYLDYYEYNRIRKLGKIVSKRLIKTDTEKGFYKIYKILTPYPTTLFLEKINAVILNIQKSKSSSEHFKIMSKILGNDPTDLIVEDSYRISLDKINLNLAKTIVLITKEINIPAKLAVLIAIFESSFGINAVKSSQNAQGIMQLTPITITEVKNRNKKQLSRLFNTFKGKCGMNDSDLYNVIIGLLYIKLIAKIHNIDLFDRNQEMRNWGFIICAYNIGPYGITKYIGSDKNLPEETQKHISRMHTGMQYIYCYDRYHFV